MVTFAGTDWPNAYDCHDLALGLYLLYILLPTVVGEPFLWLLLSGTDVAEESGEWLPRHLWVYLDMPLKWIPKLASATSPVFVGSVRGGELGTISSMHIV